MASGEARVAIQENAKPMKQPAVYIMADKRNGTLYTGVTSNLVKRVCEHKEGLVDGFDKKYGCKLRLCFMTCAVIYYQLLEEKNKYKAAPERKNLSYEYMNPKWCDLCEAIS